MTKQSLDDLFNRLWAKAVDTEGYDTNEWQAFRAAIADAIKSPGATKNLLPQAPIPEEDLPARIPEGDLSDNVLRQFVYEDFSGEAGELDTVFALSALASELLQWRRKEL